MKKTELEAQREAAAYTSDVGTSLVSSDESQHGPDADFEVEDILSQRIWDGDDETVQYLLKYTDYPMHRCTWEPKNNVRKALRGIWKDKRDSMGKEKRDEWGRKNEQKFEEARKKADAAKQRRHQKREKLRKEVALEKKDMFKKKGVVRRISPAARGHQAPDNSKSKGAVTSGRKRRVVMSSDDELVESSDDESSSSDSVPLFQKQTREKVKLRRDEQAVDIKGPSHPSSKPSERKTPQYEQRTPASTQAKNSSAGNTAKRVQQVMSITKNRLPGDADSSVVKPSIEAKSSVGNERGKSIPTGPPFNQDQYVPRDLGPIKIVNEQKHPQRKEWNTQNKHFHTLKFRGIAEKRSRVEGTPDFNELEFVNGVPAEAPKKPVENTSRADAGDDLYGRREPGQSRRQNIDSSNGPSSTTANVALQSYEMGKIPMTCYDWEHGNNCKFTPQQCRFLHREKDQNGKLLPLTTWDGKVPPKYRSPPETCWYWFCEDSCRKPEDECNYAHDNTGHLSTGDGKTIPIDPKIQPGSAEAREIGAATQKHKDVTCWFWFKDAKGCLKSADQCAYAHKNTGLLGNPAGVDFQPIDPNEKPVRKFADPTEKPVRKLPKFGSPPLTCFFWLRGDQGCNKSDEDCNFVHKNTGWLANFGQTMQIDPNEEPKVSTRRSSIPRGPVNHTLPASNRDLPLHMKTCFFWNEYNCNKSEENCRSLHRYTGIVADPPESWIRRHPLGSQQHFRDEPVSMQVDDPSCTRVDRLALMQIDEPLPALSEKVNPQSVNTRGGGNALFGSADDSSDRALSPQQKNSRARITAVSTIQPVDMKHRIEAALPLDHQAMFSCNGNQYEDVIAGQNALVLYDPVEHMEEHELISRWLILNHVTVFNMWMGFDNAWNAFKNLILEGGSGIIIATPDFEGYASLPGFGDVLRGTVRLWSIGNQETADYSIWDPKASPVLHYDRFQIFPHGGVIYITDDVFERKPQLALKIVEHFITMIEAGRRADSDIISGMYINDGILLWRLGVRPELLKWIGDICMNHPTELEQGDPDYVSLEKLYVLLSDSGYCEPDGTFEHPADNRRLDFFPIISARQELAEEIGLYYEARRRSQHDANTDMVHHYSGLVVMERRNYRQYFVVHTDPEQVDWKETITNIDEIMTPERCIEYFEQDAEGNRFENYAWTYPEKRADSVAA